MTESRLQTLSDWVGFSIFSSEVIISLCFLIYALVLIARQRNNTISDILVMHLCACEFVAVIFGYCLECLYYWSILDYDDNTIHILLYTALYVSVYVSIFVIVLDRVLAVHLVFKYKAVVTKKKLVVVFSVLWLFSLATGLLRNFKGVSPWLFLDNAMLLTIVSSYLYIIISVYKRRRGMSRSNLHPKSALLKYQIPLFIVCSFVLTLLIPDLVYILKPELYCIWFQVIWSLNYISDPLGYVIFTKFQNSRYRKNQIAVDNNQKSDYLSQQNSRNTRVLNNSYNNSSTAITVIELK